MGKCITKEINPKNLTHLKDTVLEINDARLIKKSLSKNSKIMIRKSLKKHNLFSKMTDDDYLVIFKNILLFEVRADRKIFDQGDSGTIFYIVENGKLAVIRNGIKKTILIRGDYFGDMALLTDSPRRATIYTIENTYLWGIIRGSFLEVVRNINLRYFSENKSFISNLKFFYNIPETQIDLLTQAVIEQEFLDSTRIICEGDEGILLHIIKRGKAIVKLRGSEKFRLFEGEMFGESAVLGLNKINQFSVYSVERISVVSLSIQNIEKILGNDFKGILYKNQAKNSLLSNKYFKLMSRESLDRIIESLEWKILNPEDEALPNPIENSLVYVLVYGSVRCENRMFKNNEAIGFLYKKKDSNLIGMIHAESDVILGVISISEIETIAKMHFNHIKKQLKIMNTLKKLEFFSDVTQKKLRFIADMTVKEKYENNEIIYKVNDEAKNFYIIKSGGAKIYENGKILRVLGKYDIFGDNCLLDKFRINSAKAVGDCKCLSIKGDQFLELTEVKDNPLYRRTKSSLSSFHINELILLKFIKNSEERHCFLTYVHNKDTYYYVEVLDKNSVISTNSFEKLLHEKNIAITIEHPLVMRLLKTFCDSNFVYMVYENFHVSSLKSILNEPLTEDQSKFLAAALLNILECFHSRSVIYREFDPDHLSILNTGYPFISSFHSAKVVKDRTKTFIGSVTYSAPELIIGKRYTKSVNFWSLGVMVYQFLYGSLPFEIDQEENPFQIFKNIMKAKISFPKDSKFIRANEIIIRMLDVDGDKRADFDEVKYSRWLDSIDWERISLTAIESPLKLKISISKISKQKECISLSRYLHEVYKDNLKSTSPVIINKKKQINWDKFF